MEYFYQSRILQLKDGTMETILSERDFEELLDKYLGTEAAEYFHIRFCDLDEMVQKADEYEDQLDEIDSLESKVDDLEEETCTLSDKVEELEKEIEEKECEISKLEAELVEYRSKYG